MSLLAGGGATKQGPLPMATVLPLPALELFDSHCHLDSPELKSQLEAVLIRARVAGVRWLCNIGSGYGPDEAAAAVRTAETHPQIFAAIGVHPHDAAKVDPTTLPRMRELAR